MPWSRSAASRISYAIVPLSVPTRRPRKSASCTKLSGVRRSDTQHLAKLIIRKGDSVAGPARGRVFDAAQSDVGVAPGNRLIDRRERDLDEAGRAAESACDELGDLDIEADDAGRVGWIGFDIGRAAFGVTGPSEKRWGLRRKSDRARRYQQ